MRSRSIETGLGMALLLLFAGLAQACNVPVFRYALERWRPDAYEVVLFHRGKLTEENEAALAPLYKAEEQQLVTLRLVNLDKPLEPDFQQLWDSQAKPELPWMVVLYPTQLRIEAPVWSGPFTTDTAGVLVDSPARQELAKRLMAGQTAVWLLLESGDSKVDSEAEKLVQSQIKELEESLELPELTASPDDEIRSALPLTVAFSVLRVPRDDPQERLLVQMLLGSEPDLRERNDPILYPLFGRGRALLPLIGAGITVDNITDAALFLVGPCSCQLKEFNPGFDVLNTADWDRIWGDDAAAALVAQAEEAAVSQPGEQVPIPKGIPVAAPPAPVPAPVALVDLEERRGWLALLLSKRILLLGGIILAVVLAIVALVASQRSHARARHEHE